jgi:hypothetical protein
LPRDDVPTVLDSDSTFKGGELTFDRLHPLTIDEYQARRTIEACSGVTID